MAATLISTCGLAQTRSDAGEHEDAERLLRTALERPEAGWGDAERRTLELCLGAALVRAGKTEAAVEALEAALEGVTEGELESRACLAALGRLDPLDVEREIEASGHGEECYTLLAAHHWLGLATGKRDHEERAHDLLRGIVDQAPSEDQASLASRLPLYRDVEAAWRKVPGASSASASPPAASDA